MALRLRTACVRGAGRRYMAENGWHRVDPSDLPEEGRVRGVIVDGRSVALSRCGARLGALENRCGATGIHVTHRDQLPEAMTRLFSTPGPALLCVEQDAELL